MEQKTLDQYLRIGKATDLEGREKKIYRLLEIFPGAFSWLTLIGLILLSYLYPVYVAYFVLAFDVYWLLLVIYLGIHLVAAYRKLQVNLVTDWKKECEAIPGWDSIIQLIIFPTVKESLDVIRSSFKALLEDGFPSEKMIVVLATEERAGEEAQARAKQVQEEFGKYFRNFIITVHPDGIAGELKGKGANQAWAAKQAKEILIDKENIPYEKILVSVFDIDTIVIPGYFYCLTAAFLKIENPYRASFQPIPIYHNNIWQAPFFSRVAASSNTFWQMMQQIRQEKLSTYSSHSMTFKALADIGFWSTNMVSEDSRIFWHCFCYYNGDYRVEPLYFPVSMDVTMDKNAVKTMKSLYIQQRRWGWGAENIPYLVFNYLKRIKQVPQKKFIVHILTQVYGFHSWATNALIIALLGWMPSVLGGERFRQTVLSSNLPLISQTLMTFAMVGMVLSAIISTLLLPKKPKNFGLLKKISLVLEWLILPVSIIVFGSFPALEAQTRLMFGKYMGFKVTPKER